jgi:hypothetical protein
MDHKLMGKFFTIFFFYFFLMLLLSAFVLYICFQSVLGAGVVGERVRGGVADSQGLAEIQRRLALGSFAAKHGTGLEG